MQYRRDLVDGFLAKTGPTSPFRDLPDWMSPVS